MIEIKNPDIEIELLNEIKELRKQLEKRNLIMAIQKQQINELLPKETYYDIVLNCENVVSSSTLAKDYGWNATKLNEYLSEKGIQYKTGDIWLLNKKYSDQGYTQTKVYETEKNQNKVRIYWTQKGRLFIYSLLKRDNILPLIEQ